MELSKNYSPSYVESKWNDHWKSQQYFNSFPDKNKKAFTVVIPPPNVTGVLHMGHTLNETVQDILVRKARMSGFNACWVPGSDHASIATEAKVVQMLKEKGIQKSELSRQDFLKYAFEWKEKYGNIIYTQIEKLGCSVDWNRVSFTMDNHFYQAVIKVFVDLYKKGLIYRGARMINWDSVAQTALSDEEVEYKDVQGKLYYVKYNIVDSDEFVIIATQRPETIMGDSAICVNPHDNRFIHLKNKKVIVPLVNREVPIIFDEYVDMEFGTGALKVTPAHDINDYNLGLKHNLEIIDTLNSDGTLSEAAEVFVGLERFEARKKCIETLYANNQIIREEDYQTRLGFSQRTNAVVEPRISTQWFVKMKEFAQPALKEVVEGNIQIHPGDKFLATYKYWLENVKDWCISRQLWWGQQIPAWYDENGNCYVAENLEQLHLENPEIKNLKLVQDEDVMDTWFSSWLWPIEVFKGITKPNNEEFKYYYPTSVLVTGQDIIFFWVARMVMAGMHYENIKPFEHVYFTGMVRDKQGRKMSKSLGNSPDLLKLIDKYGADAVRFGIMISSPAGNDLLFDEAAVEQGRNFNNKLWNALKLIKMFQLKNILSFDYSKEVYERQYFGIHWFENRLNETKKEIEHLLSQFKLSEALKILYSLIWDDFCSWYLEWIKPGYDGTIDGHILNKTEEFYEELLQLLHPFMPFITEEIYHELNTREAGDDLCIKQFLEINEPDESILHSGKLLKNIISLVRDAKVKQQLKPKDEVDIFIQSIQPVLFKNIDFILRIQCFANEVSFTNSNIPNSIVVPFENHKIYIVSKKEIDTSSQKIELEKDLEYQKKFLASVSKKLSNKNFVQNAKPEVVLLEQKKQADAEARINTIEESLKNL